MLKLAKYVLTQTCKPIFLVSPRTISSDTGQQPTNGGGEGPLADADPLNDSPFSRRKPESVTGFQESQGSVQSAKGYAAQVQLEMAGKLMSKPIPYSRIRTL